MQDKKLPINPKTTINYAKNSTHKHSRYVILNIQWMFSNTAIATGYYQLNMKGLLSTIIIES